MSCIISRSPVVVVVRANINHRAKKNSGERRVYSKEERGREGGLLLEPVPPLLACLHCHARQNKKINTHT